MTSINALISLLKYYAQLPYSTEKTSVLYADWNCDFSLEPDVSPVFFFFFFFISDIFVVNFKSWRFVSTEFFFGIYFFPVYIGQRGLLVGYILLLASLCVRLYFHQSLIFGGRIVLSMSIHTFEKVCWEQRKKYTLEV